jgi:hypothetical protein
MRRAATAAFAALVGLGACSQGTNHQPQANLEEADQAAENAASAPDAPAVNANNTISNASLPEPKGPIDPKSVEAAGQVVQHYGARIERSRWLQAERLWGDINLARQFATDLGARFREVHLEIGDLGHIEGAAGSMYTAVPVVFYGQSRRGDPLRLPASITLRRVNDVPGSTERQRQWHIERIEWKGRA